MSTRQRPIRVTETLMAFCSRVICTFAGWTRPRCRVPLRLSAVGQPWFDKILIALEMLMLLQAFISIVTLMGIAEGHFVRVRSAPPLGSEPAGTMCITPM